MKITRITIKRVVPKDGLIGFVSLVIDDALYLGNIAIFGRLNKDNEYRLVFPEKTIGENKIKLFYPVNSELYFEMEQAIMNELNT